MLKKLFKTELGRGALFLFITINLYNLLNFFFHFAMGRLLTPSNYGILAVLMSLVYLYSAPNEAVQNLIAKYTAKFNIKNEKGKIHYLISKSLKKGFIVSFAIFLILIPISIFLAGYLSINFWLIFITNMSVFFAFSLPISRGVLQGRKEFSKMGISMVIESVLKLIFSISLVVFGFAVFGATIGLILGLSAGLVFSLYFNKEVMKEKEKKVSFKGVYTYSIPYFISMIVILLALSLDIILAKRFFSPEIAGQYAVLSMLGKMIFFGTVPINKAMFPLTAERHEKKQDSLKLFFKSIGVVIVICAICTLIYALFPELIVKILYGHKYLSIAPLLVYSAIALSFLSLTNLVFVYGLSTNRMRNTLFLFIFLFIEIFSLFMFHNSISEYIIAFMVSNAIMFIGSLFFLKWGKTHNEN